MLGAVQGFIRFADSPSSASSSSSSSTAAVTRDVDLVFNIIDGDAKARKAVALMQERFPDVAIYAVRCGSHIVHNAAQAVCTACGRWRTCLLRQHRHHCCRSGQKLELLSVNGDDRCGFCERKWEVKC